MDFREAFKMLQSLRVKTEPTTFFKFLVFGALFIFNLDTF